MGEVHEEARQYCCINKEFDRWPEAKGHGLDFFLSAGQLHRQHPREIANILSELVRKTEEAEATELPGAANSIAVALRPYVSSDEIPRLTASVGGVPQYVSWLDKLTITLPANWPCFGPTASYCGVGNRSPRRGRSALNTWRH